MEKPLQPVLSGNPQVVNVASLPIQNPNGVASVYANNAGLSMTPWDMRFIFTEIIIEGPQPRSELRASVVMTPSHAKALAGSLSKYLAAYEKIYGSVTPPASPPAR
jgi:hypothetical protein